MPAGTFLGFTRYQWLVLFAAWLGWGFDVFDGLLFNFVSRLCIPDLLHLAKDTDPKKVKEITTYWTGAMSSILLLGWAAGGILFGKLTDRIGRTRTLLLTMITYALATAACAGAPNIWFLLVFRFISSLGIGGEWAAGASLVAETVPEDKRVTAGALLYTSAPLGILLATWVNKLFTVTFTWSANDPSTAWRIVFLTGLIPAVVAVLIRLNVREPESFTKGHQPQIRELFTPELRRRTLGGLAMALIALVSWWSISNFIPLIGSFLADDVTPKPDAAGLRALKAQFATTASAWFCYGGLIGTLLTVPVANHMGRRAMFGLYFVTSAAATWATFAAPMAPETRLYMFGLVGLTVFGVFGSFTFYLPELFPTRLRGTGAGFCYNTGRILTAAFPFGIGVVALGSYNVLHIIRWVAIVPIIGLVLLALGVAEETRGRKLA